VTFFGSLVLSKAVTEVQIIRCSSAVVYHLRWFVLPGSLADVLFVVSALSTAALLVPVLAVPFVSRRTHVSSVLLYGHLQL